MYFSASKISLLLLLCATWASAQTTSSAGTSDVGTRRIYFTNGNTPGTVPATFCASAGNNGTCEWPQYVESVLLGGSIVGVLIAIIVLIFGCCFYVGRPCGLCGGKKPSHGIFKAGDEINISAGEGYTTKVVWILKPLILLGFVILIGVSVIGFNGNERFHTSLADFIDEVNTTGTGIVNTAEDALIELEVIIARAEADNISISFNTADIDSIIATADDLLQQADDFGSQAESYELVRYRLVLSAYAISICVYFLLLLSSCVNGHIIASFVTLFAWPAIFLGWLSFSFSNPLAIVLSDFCAVVDDISSLSFVPQEIQDFIECDNSTFAQFTNSINAGIDPVESKICELYDTLCQNNDLCTKTNSTNCRVFYCSRACDRQNLLATFQTVIVNDLKLGCPNRTGSDPSVLDPNSCGTIRDFDTQCLYDVSSFSTTITVPPIPCEMINRTWEACTTRQECYLDNPIRAQLFELNEALGLFDELQVFLDTYVYKLLSCEPVRDIWNSSKTFVCVNVQPSIVQMWTGSVLVALSWMVGLIFAILGIKRFNKNYRASKRHDVQPTGIFKSMRNAQKTMGRKTGLSKLRTKVSLGAPPTELRGNADAEGGWDGESSSSTSASSREAYIEPYGDDDDEYVGTPSGSPGTSDHGDHSATNNTQESSDYGSGSAYGSDNTES